MQKELFNTYKRVQIVNQANPAHSYDSTIPVFFI